MYEFIGKVIVGFILVGVLMAYTTLGSWSLLGFLAPFLIGGK